MANASPQNFSFKFIHSANLTDSEHIEFNEIYRESIERDFPNRTQTEYENLVSALELSRRDANAGVGGNLQLPDQGYARPVTAVVRERTSGAIKLILATADNASAHKLPFGLEKVSPLKKRVNRAEIKAKLERESLLAKRWATFASRAVTDDMLEAISDTETVSVVDVAGFLAIGFRYIDQPVSSYPWKGESMWADIITSWGLEHTKETRYVYAFGKEYPPVTQDRYITPQDDSSDPGVMLVRRRIANKPGSHEAINEVKRR